MKTVFKRIGILVVSCFLFAALSSPLSADPGKININTATVNQLLQLQRIGPSYADRIVAYREQNGAFKTPQEIMKVKGIGEKTFEANKDVIVVKDEKLE